MRGTILYAALGALGIACVRPDKAPPASDTTASRPDTAAASAAAAPPAAPAPAPAPTPAPTATKVATVLGFLAPESVLHDSAQDIYFVSNINGSPMAKDNNGFISRVRPDGAVENLKFIEGGRSGVTLNAPKGLALEGDTLWVADIDAVRAFDAKTGAAIDTVSLSKLGAVFLNDIVVGLSGALYITDTGIRFASASSSSSSADATCSAGSRATRRRAWSRKAPADSTASSSWVAGFSSRAGPIRACRATRRASR